MGRAGVRRCSAVGAVTARTSMRPIVTRIVGAELVRIRSQTIYYVLTRIKGICKVYLDRQRMAESQVA